MEIHAERLIHTFSELVAVDSPSFGERAMADCLRDRLAVLGISCKEDNAGAALGGTAGDLFARVPGTLGQPALLFCTHMDTVAPACGKRAVLHEDGRITSTGDTVLGADDLAGVAALLEVLESLHEQNIAHRPPSPRRRSSPSRWRSRGARRTRALRRKQACTRSMLRQGGSCACRRAGWTTARR